MSWNIRPNMALFFEFDKEELALAVAENADDGSMTFAIFHKINGMFYAIPPFILDNLTNELILSKGTVSQFLEFYLPTATELLQNYFGLINQPPQITNKPACVGWDLAKAVVFDSKALEFVLDSARPLPHVPV